MRLDRLSQPILVDRIIYATITIMSVLIIYDGWQKLRLIDVVGVIVGPVLAMFLAHVFSSAMAQHVEAERVLTRSGVGRQSFFGCRPPFCSCASHRLQSCRPSLPSECL